MFNGRHFLPCRLRAAGVCVPTVGLGSTPTSSHPTEAMQKLSELHPGNYIFYGKFLW